MFIEGGEGDELYGVTSVHVGWQVTIVYYFGVMDACLGYKGVGNDG